MMNPVMVQELGKVEKQNRSNQITKAQLLNQTVDESHNRPNFHRDTEGSTSSLRLGFREVILKLITMLNTRAHRSVEK
jgi:hypothetical protein